MELRSVFETIRNSDFNFKWNVKIKLLISFSAEPWSINYYRNRCSNFNTQVTAWKFLKNCILNCETFFTVNRWLIIYSLSIKCLVVSLKKLTLFSVRINIYCFFPNTRSFRLIFLTNVPEKSTPLAALYVSYDGIENVGWKERIMVIYENKLNKPKHTCRMSSLTMPFHSPVSGSLAPYFRSGTNSIRYEKPMSLATISSRSTQNP